MDGRLIVMLILLISGPTKFAFSLHCFSCYDLYTCETPYPIYCDSQSTSAMREQFEHLSIDMKVLNSTDYSCFAAHYSVNNTRRRGLSGCIVTGTVDCNHQYPSSLECSICDMELCNSAAANALSYISVFTALILSTILDSLKM